MQETQAWQLTTDTGLCRCVGPHPLTWPPVLSTFLEGDEAWDEGFREAFGATPVAAHLMLFSSVDKTQDTEMSADLLEAALQDRLGSQGPLLTLWLMLPPPTMA